MRAKSTCLPAVLFLLIAGASLADETLSFSTDVQPVLTKYGCNQGACHGSQYGKGGFKLSLRGFDDPADYFEIVKSGFGRRLAPTDPGLSLLLLKPTKELPHQGGARFPKDSAAYKTLLQWIDQGAAGPGAQDIHLAQLSVHPAVKKAVVGESFSLAAKAIFSDGSEDDVGQSASFDCSSPVVATVTPDGRVTITGRGEATVMVRFLDRVSVCRLIVPYADSQASQAFPQFVANNKIDELWLARWKELGLPPAPRCTDAEFLRRIYFDTLGTAPRGEEVRLFLSDSGPDKRERAIDAVLERPEYVDFWTTKWGDLLRINRNLLEEKGMWSFHVWLRSAFRDNMPFDQLTTELVTASGSPFQNGPANYFRVGRLPEDWAENTVQVFLGVRMQCARCHQHPFENISQRDYYGMAAFFARVGTKRSDEFGLYGQDSVVFTRETGESRHPRTGKVVRPTPLGGAPIPAEQADPYDRRTDLAKWLADPSNPGPARNLVNRYWGYYFGRGLVHPIDDVRVTNPASCAEVLDYLTDDLIAHHYDVKHLLRRLMQSRVYQAAAVGAPASDVDAENKYFTHFTIKRLSAEQLLDAVDYACGTREQFSALPAGYHAISLPDSNVASKFLDVFGRPRREVSCECERTDSPNMTQALQLLTGALLNRKVQDPKGRVAMLAKGKTPPDEAVREIYITTLGRIPSEMELLGAASAVGAAPSLKEGLEDFLWAMLNTREFQFNH